MGCSFERFTPAAPQAPIKLKATFKKVQAAGPPREIPMGKIQAAGCKPPPLDLA